MGKGLTTALLLLLTSALSAQQPQVSAYRVISTGILQLDPIVIHDAETSTTFVAGRFQGSLTIGDQTLESYGGIDAFLVAFDNNLDPIWLEQFGGEGRDEITALSLGREGTLLVAMYCASQTSTFTSYRIGNTILGGRGEADAVVARIRAVDGEVLWVRNDGGTSYEIPTGIVELDDAILVSGYFSGASRFGSDTATHSAKSNYTGYIQALDPNGNHLRVGVPIVLDTSRGSGAYTWVGTAVNGSIATVSMFGDHFTWGSKEFQQGRYLVEMGADLVPGSIITDTAFSQGCGTDWAWSAGSSIGLAVGAVNNDCKPRKTLQVRTSTTSAPRTLATYTGQPPFGLHVSATPSRALIIGNIFDSLDLVDTDVSPDYVCDTNSSSGAVIIGLTIAGTGEWAIGMSDSSSYVQVESAALTRLGFDVILQARDTLRSLGQLIPMQFNDMAILQFSDPTVSVEEHHDRARYPEARSGEGPLFVYDLAGSLLSTLTTLSPSLPPTLSSSLSTLPPGVYILRQGTHVSLCHVYGPHNIAFSVPAGPTR